MWFPTKPLQSIRVKRTRHGPNAILVQEVDFPKGRELYEQYFDGNPSENKELGTDDQDESA
jgi:hypothetical protein